MKNLLITISITFFFSCGEKIHEEVIEKFYDGRKKIVLKYIDTIEPEQLVEKIEYSYSGDTLCIEKPLEKLKMVREYSEDGKVILSVANFKEGKKNGKWTWYYDNGQLKEEGYYENDKMVGIWTSYFINQKILYQINYKDGKQIDKTK